MSYAVAFCAYGSKPCARHTFSCAASAHFAALMKPPPGVSSIRVVAPPTSSEASALRFVVQVISAPASADTAAIRVLIASRKSEALPVVGSTSSTGSK